MRNEPRWLDWRYNAEQKKIPYQARHPETEARINDESHFADYETARAVVDGGQADGLGFVLGSGWAGVDLDDCRDPKTGTIKPAAKAIVDALDSYTEVSPSQKGLKIFVKAWGKNHQRKGVEVHAGRRYYAVTGQHLEGTPTEPQDRQNEFDALIAKEFGDQIEESEPRKRAAALPASVDDGERNNVLFREACRLRQRGHSEAEIIALLDAMNTERVRPVLSEREVEEIARSAMRYEAGDTKFVCYSNGNRKGQIVADNQHNVRLALAKLGLTFTYNAFANTPITICDGVSRPVDDAVIDRAWLQIDEVFHFRPPMEFFKIFVGDLARRQSFHPVREYLDSLTWDHQPRIDSWISTYGGAEDNEYTRAVASIFLIAAVRRVRTPGCKFDELLILESEQGKLKSQALRALCPDDDWFSDDLPLGVDAKQIIERTSGKWIVEAGEMHGYSNADVERLKGMLSRQVDGPVRLAYGRLSTQMPRQFVMAGTTNRLAEYLRDSTGNRRFWPIRVKKFDIDALKRDRDQLWAEAAFREACGDAIRLPERLWSLAAVEQESRRQVDPWEELLDDRLAGGFERPAILVDELWAALGEAGSQRRKNDAERLGQIMQRHGFVRKKKIDVMYVNEHRTARRWAWVDDTDPARVEIRHVAKEATLEY